MAYAILYFIQQGYLIQSHWEHPTQRMQKKIATLSY